MAEAENKNVTYESLIKLLDAFSKETVTKKLSANEISINKDISITSQGITFNNVSILKEEDTLNSEELINSFDDEKNCFIISNKKNKLIKITKKINGNLEPSPYFFINSDGEVTIDEDWLIEDSEEDQSNDEYKVEFFELKLKPTLSLEKDKLTINGKELTEDKINKIDDIEYMTEEDLNEIFNN